MNKDNNILDDQFRSKLENFEQAPPLEVWNRVQQSIGTGKKKFLYYRLSGVAAVLLIALFIGWQQLRNNEGQMIQELTELNSDEPIPAETESNPVLPEQPKLAENSKEADTQLISDSQDKNSQVAEVKTTAFQFEDKEGASSIIERVHESLAELQSIFRNKLQSDSNGNQLKMESPGSGSNLSERDRLLIADNLAYMEMEDTRTKDNKWNLGVAVAPSYTVYETSQSETYSLSMSYQGASDELNVQGSFTVEYELNEKWSVQTGVTYSRNSQGSQNYSTSDNLFYSVPEYGLEYTTAISDAGLNREMNSVAGVIEFNSLPTGVDYIVTAEQTMSSDNISISNSDFEQQFEYLEVPFIINYKLMDSVVDIQLKGGLNAGILVGNVVFMENNSEKYEVGKTLGMRKLNYSTSMGLGLGYSLSEKLQLKFEPRVKYYLQSLNKNSDLVYKPYVFSFYTGISYNF